MSFKAIEMSKAAPALDDSQSGWAGPVLGRENLTRDRKSA